MGNSLFHGVTGEKVRVRSIKEHAATTAHKSLQARADPQGGALVSAFDRMDAAIKEKMVKLFNIAYFIAKEEAAFTMFPKLVALHQMNGLDLGSTYNNDQACRIFITAIGSCFFEELQQSLKSARFFSIMSDSSVDRSVKDQELIYCTYLQNGKPVNQLIQIVALDHAHSQGILDAILAGLLKVVVGEGDLKKRLVGFGCDGTSVMLGVNNGVTARLQRLCPSLVPIWCVAHRLELVALDSVKQVPQLQDIKQTLRAIHKHYTCSAKASRELEEISKAMEISIVRPGNTEGTRWLPHMSHALEALMRNYRPILMHFENHASDPNDKEASAAMKGRAKLVQKSLKQYKMLLFIHLMLDVLQELKQLSLLFQRDGLTLQMVSDGLQTTTLALVAMQTNPGPRLHQFMEEVGAGSIWQGVQLSRTNADDDTFNALKLCLTNSFCEFISERFKSLETGVLKATSTLFDLSNWPEDTTNLTTFGTAELNAFMEHFHPVLETCENFESVEAARQEWLDLKVLIARHYRHLDSQVLWQRLIQGAIGRDGQFQHMKLIAELTSGFLFERRFSKQLLKIRC
ncbi:hypothetical protein SKAU_G00063070 [Synaphobranchus kaupii]|uniref:Uncharacterized protein n=1 Tax=Synaphobranchus kaupii TaxID=118154 RepID=A0A9Q1G5B4_SYNKA|nr:hypothetical protein SKAU_G00063070 [Synaphobranchus kaupii]